MRARATAAPDQEIGAYKYSDAYEWFDAWIAEQPPERILRELRAFALAAGCDELEERYQDEMDADGYFEVDS